MTLHAICFYPLSAVIVFTTVLAVSCRNMVHAILYLVCSFIGVAMMFLLLGAPMPAVLEIVIYAGGIMVLFLFVIMMLKVGDEKEKKRFMARCGLAGVTTGVYLGLCVLLRYIPGADDAPPLPAMDVSPAEFGNFVFTRHWLSVEVISLMLLIALMGALVLGIVGRDRPPGSEGTP